MEECYKFLKQSFGIEKARVASYEGIRCLLGVSMFAWQVLIDVSADDELKSIVIAEAKMIGLHMVYKKWGNAKIF